MEPPKTEESYSTPQSWEVLSDALKEYGVGSINIEETTLKMLVYGCLSPSHAGMFLAFMKQMKNKNLLSDIMNEKAK